MNHILFILSSVDEHLDCFHVLTIVNKVVCFCLVSQSCPTLCDPMDCSQAPLSMEILQARILEWVVIPSPEDLSDPGIKPRSPTLQTDSLLYELQGSSCEQHVLRQMLMIGWGGTRTHHTKKTVRNWGAQLAK